MIGLCGAHRTGKTTLAKAYADKFGLLFLETKVSHVFAELGLDPKGPFDFPTRLRVQFAVLDAAEKLYNQQKRNFIADRTPLDMLAYTMAEAIGNSVDNESLEYFKAYTERCFTMTNYYFGTILVIQPGIPLVEAEGKALANSAYIEHLNSLILGLTIDERLDCHHFFIPRRLTSIADRLESVHFAVSRTMANITAAIESGKKDGSIIMQ